MKQLFTCLLMISIVTFFYSCDKKNESPTCTFSRPLSGQTFDYGKDIDIKIVAEDIDGKVKSVKLLINNVEFESKNRAPYNFTIYGCVLTPGTHLISAVATDNNRAQTETHIAININAKDENTSPTCNILYPQSHQEFLISENIQINIAAGDADGIISEVQLFIDDIGYNSISSFPYNFTIKAGDIKAGYHTIKAIAIDNENAKAESSVIVKINGFDPGDPNFITFTNHFVPDDLIAISWYIDATRGYDDSFSLRATEDEAIFVLTRTSDDNINFFEFYLKGTGYVNFLIDNKIAKICELTDEWKKHNFYLETGKHVLKWECYGTANIDAIFFKQETEFEVGMFYQGGIISYLDDSKQHGLITAPQDFNSQVIWGDYVVTEAIGVDIGTGKDNTIKIVDTLGNLHVDYAAIVCSNYNSHGYKDWFLPSIVELNTIYLNKDLIGGIKSETYWSSSEVNNTFAWLQNLDTGAQFFGHITASGQPVNSKVDEFYIRAVRYFNKDNIER